MLVLHVDGIKAAATKEITESVMEDLNKRVPTKHDAGVTWYIFSEYNRENDKTTLRISQTQLI